MTSLQKQQIINNFLQDLSVCLSVCLSNRLSVRPTVRPTLIFLEIGSLAFSDNLHDVDWLWHLVTDQARFLKKTLAAPIWD